MAVDMFLKIDGVKGESYDHKHKDEIDILSWSWGLSQSGTAHQGGGAGAGKVNVQDVSITKYVDKASPELMQRCCSGKHFPSATIVIRKAGENPLEYLKIQMDEVLVSSVSTGGTSHDDRLTEHIALNFAKFEVTYKEQKKDGSGGPEVKGHWNIVENKA